MTISKGLYIFFVSVLLLAGNCFAERIETTLTPSEIIPGERAFLDIKLIAPEESKAETVNDEIYVSDDFLLQHKKIKVLDKKFLKEETFPTYRYELTAYAVESLRIPPIQIKWGTDLLSTESIPLTVKATREPSDDEIRAAFDEVSKPIPYWRVARLFVIAALTYLVCWLIWPYLQKLPGLIPSSKHFAKIPREEDPHLWLKREWKQFKRKRAQNENQELIDEWFRIVKTYFAKKEKKTVRAWTTNEFKRQLAGNQQAGQVFPLLKACDELKFSQNKRDTIAISIDNWIKETERILLCGN